MKEKDKAPYPENSSDLTQEELNKILEDLNARATVAETSSKGIQSQTIREVKELVKEQTPIDLILIFLSKIYEDRAYCFNNIDECAQEALMCIRELTGVELGGVSDVHDQVINYL
jgi:hypothetical protein